MNEERSSLGMSMHELLTSTSTLYRICTELLPIRSFGSVHLALILFLRW